MMRFGFAGLVAGILTIAPSYGALITYATRAGFNAAAPGLPTETFEAGLVAAGGVTPCNGPLSSASASACFGAAGALLPGVIYSAQSGVTQPNMVVLGAGFAGLNNASRVVGPNSFGDTLNLAFTQANAVGFDVFAGQSLGNISISVFNSSNVLIQNFIVPGVLGGSFFGVISDSELIGRINIASLSTTPGEVIDNLSFGHTGIPEPSSLLLSAGALTILLFRVRGRFANR